MLAPERAVQPFSSPDFLYQLKFDGYRCMAGIEADDGLEPDTEEERRLQVASRVQLRTKSGASCGSWFPELLEPLAALPGGPHVLDGEACCLREDGTSDFNLFQERARRRRWYPGAPQVTYAIFDILVYNGRRVMNLPLVRRKALLSELLVGAKAPLLYVKDLPADANLFYSMTLPEDEGGLGLEIEGVVAKKRDSVYQPGVRSPNWLKIKRRGWQDGRVFSKGWGEA